MEEIDNELRQGVLTGIFVALNGEEHSEFQDSSSSSIRKLEEIKSLLDEEVSNEVAYLRDAGIVSTETYPDGTVDIELNSELTEQASHIAERLEENYGNSIQEIADSDEYLGFKAPEGWPDWSGPRRKDETDGSISYDQTLGPLCAVLSVYGEERLRGADITEYSLEAMSKAFSLEEYELSIDLERNLEILEQAGYIEKHSTHFNDVYRLADDKNVKNDAEMIAEFRNRIFSGHPQNMALAYEEADRIELEDKGVKLVQRPEERSVHRD